MMLPCEIKTMGVFAFLYIVIDQLQILQESLQHDNFFAAVFAGSCGLIAFYYAYKFCRVRLSKRGILN